MISIIIPSYGRASKIKDVVANIEHATHGPFEIYVVVEKEEYDAYGNALGGHYGPKFVVLINEHSKNYAGAINTAARWSTADFIFMGADDVTFHPGWDDEALKVMHSLPNIKVVGTNDLWNEYVLEGWHSTHTLVARDYIDSPGGVVYGDPGIVLFEGYDHNYVDTEFIGTAKARAVFQPALKSVVEHRHFTNRKSELDSTYEKGYAKIQEDSALYNSRRELWWNLSR